MAVHGSADIDSPSFPFDEVYRDDGCSIAPRCLSCPLPECRYEGGMVGAWARLHLAAQDKRTAVMALFRSGATIEQVQEVYSYSIHTLRKIQTTMKQQAHSA